MEKLKVLIHVACFVCVNSQNFQELYRLIPPNVEIMHNGTIKENDTKAVLEMSNTEVANRAQRTLAKGGMSNHTDDSKFEVTDRCLNHTKLLLEALVSRQHWALGMVDAMGKPHNGLMVGHLNWMGSYEECRAVKAEVAVTETITSPFVGRYCTASFPLNISSQGEVIPRFSGVTLSIGLCVPNSCSSKDTTALINTLLSLLPLDASTLPAPSVLCQQETLEYDTKAIVAMVICSVFGFVMVIATVYDIIRTQWMTKEIAKPSYEKNEKSAYRYIPKTSSVSCIENGSANNGNAVRPDLENTDKPNESGHTKNGDIVQIKPENSLKDIMHKQGTLGCMLLSFSIYSNGAKILNTDQPSGTLSAINGIRFISMTWVILGHNFGFLLPSSENMVTYGMALIKRFTFEAIKNATLSVDTFFALSGLLVSYLSLKEMEKRGGALKFQWAMFYFHRFWRLTPPYMLFMMFYVCLMAYWYDGPWWLQTGINQDTCVPYWWRNLLYINNFFPMKDMCMAWSWYLANDMQFYVLSPLMLVPFYYSSILGVISCSAMVLANFISAGIISMKYELGTNVMFDRTGHFFDEYYVKPWCRIGPYVVGFITGYILYRTSCKICIPKLVNFAGWLTATAIALLTLYGTYDSSGIPSVSGTTAAVYNATGRTAWAIAICWVIVACATGNGGWVNTVLSWKAFIPLSRLTYCAYLVHPVVIITYQMGRRTPIHFTDIEAVIMFLGNLFMSYIVAFIVSLAFESPMMGLEKVLLRRNK